MIHKASIEIVVDTEKEKSEEWVKLSIKADPKVNMAKTTHINMENYPAVLIAAKIMELIEDELKGFKQQELL